jgi:hypothetical protein
VTRVRSLWFVQRISHRRLTLAISAFGGAVEIVLALRRLAFDLGLLDLFAQGGQPPYRVLLDLPLCLQRVGSRFQMGQFALEFRQPLL